MILLNMKEEVVRRKAQAIKLTYLGGFKMATYYLAVDIGASSGRHILGHMEDGKMVLEEVYRFENGMVKKDGELC